MQLERRRRHAAGIALNTLATARLYGILDLGYVAKADAVAVAHGMVEGGIHVVQVRAKGFDVDSIARLVDSVLPIFRSAGIPLIVNDHPALVRATGADGVHIGQDDMPVEEARRLAGADALIGLSTHSPDQARAAQGVDYIGFGPLFSTPTKPDYPSIGLQDIAAVHRDVSIPIFCIGGIKQGNLDSVLSAGARRVVVVSGILESSDIRGTIRDLLARLGSEKADAEGSTSRPD